MLVTHDGAKSWRRVLSIPGGFWGVDAYDPTRAWAVGVTGLYRTVDGGMRWRRAGEPAESLVSVVFASPTTGYGLTLTGRVVVSRDAGASWRASGWSGRGSALCAPERGIVFVSSQADAAIWRSGDGGISWRKVAPGFAHIEELAGWYSYLSCQRANAVELAQAFCAAACAGAVDSRVRQSIDGALKWRMIATQETWGGHVDTRPVPGLRVLIDQATAVGTSGVCLLGSQSNPASFGIDCIPHSGTAYSNASIPTLTLPAGESTVTIQGAHFLNANTGWVLIDEYTAGNGPPHSRAITELWSTHTAGLAWQPSYVSPIYRDASCPDAPAGLADCWPHPGL